MAGIFANTSGLVFSDVSGEADCPVIESEGKRFPRVAVQPHWTNIQTRSRINPLEAFLT